MIDFIIADDEYFVVERIKRILDYNALGFRFVDACLNGRDALESIRMHQPQLAILDIQMPYLTGLEIAKQLKEDGQNTQVILLTSYDYFEYARQAISYNVFNYLLKPVVKEELQKTLLSFSEHFTREQTRQKKEQQFDTQRQADILSALLHGLPVKYVDAEEETAIRRAFALSSANVLFLLKLENPDFTELYSQFFCEQLLSSHTFPVLQILPLENNIFCFLAQADTDPARMAMDLKKYLRAHQPRPFQLVYVPFREAEITSIYRLARTALDDTFFLPLYSVHTPPADRPGVSHLPLQITSELSASLKSGNLAFAENLIHNSFLCLKQKEYACAANLEFLLAQIYSCLAAFSEDSVPFSENSISFAIRKLTGSLLSCDAICEQCIQYIREFSAHSAQTSQAADKLLSEIMRYIKEQYARPDLNVAQIAGCFGYSVNYISSLFHQGTGISIVQYITRCRMTEAIRLLQKQIPVNVVATRVGYSSPYYFSRRFKQYYGYAPSDTRYRIGET